jgi:hypothetical protein
MRFTLPWPRAVRVCAASAVLVLGVASAVGHAQSSRGTSRAGAPTQARPTPSGQQQRAFATPEEAVRALIEALQAPTAQPLVPILGRQVLDSVPYSERQADEMRRAAGNWLALQPFEIAYQDETQRRRAVALVGREGVPLPAMLMRSQRGWVFDQEATIAAMRERRIGVNEANAISALRALARAQERFRLSDRSGDGVLQYARRIRSSGPGQVDGLVGSEFVPGPSVDLLNHAFAEAEGEPGNPRLRPLAGYAYKILTGQGASAEGGARSYLVDGRMTEGFAVVAWPVRPGETGLSTFIMDHRGTIFEREFGDLTAKEAQRLTAFDPGAGWARVQAPE